MALLNAEHPINLEDSDSYNPGIIKPFSIGMTKVGRLIMQKQLDRNYKLTEIRFELESGAFLSASIPAVIRVYQTDFESDARYLVLNQAIQSDMLDTGLNYFTATIDLDITDRQPTREVNVDAWAPSAWTGWAGGNTSGFDTSTMTVGGHTNAQPFLGELQILGRPLHIIPT